MRRHYKPPPRILPNEGVHRELLADAIQAIQQGRQNVTGDITLEPNETTTELLDPRINVQSILFFMPTTANAAAIQASIYVTDKVTGKAIINHTSSANTDLDFEYLIIG